MRINNKIIVAILALIGILVIIFVGIVVKIFSVNEKITDFAEIFYQDRSDLPMKTNSWFSSAYQFPTQPIYIHPLAVQFDQSGMWFSYPKVTTTANTVAAGFDKTCKVDFGTNIDKIEVVSYSDWQVRIKLIYQTNEAEITLTKGIPFIYIEADEIFVSCNNSSPYLTGQLVAFESNGRKYYAEAKEKLLSTVNGDTIKLSSSQKHFRISAEFESSQNSILESSWFIPTNTIVNWESTENEILTTYTFSSSVKENTYITMYPHQYNNLQIPEEVIGTYETALGKLSVVNSKKFTTSISKPLLPISFLKIQDLEQKKIIQTAVIEDIDIIANQQLTSGVYFRGTQLGALATLAQLSDIYAPEKLDIVLDKLESGLVNIKDEFIYDNKLKMLISRNSEFGNNEGNDHHFHYGYYIRAAAILIKYRPQLRNELQPTVEAMIKDIASRQYGDYPKLRSFSIYEGHSWADGDANFADGNNQESTSEALNAWYAIYLWADTINDYDQKSLGEWLFAQELKGAQTYWFGIGNPFPSEYTHTIASIVWGAKRDFATWFSAEKMHIFGIQILPITPASSYSLRQIINLNQIDDLGNQSRHEWGDIYISYLSFYDPERAASLLNGAISTKGLLLKSLLYQTVYQNLN